MYMFSKFIVKTMYEDRFLVYSTLTDTLLSLPLAYEDKFIDFNIKNFNDDEIKEFVEAKIIFIGSDEDVLGMFKDKQKNGLSDSIEIQITPSATCQLGCDYCGQKHTKDKILPELDEPILEDLKHKIAISKCKNVYVQWYGGEPLTGFAHIIRLSKKLLELATKEGIGYSSHIITNGYSLTLDRFKELIKYEIKSFQITLDGNQEEHDKRRYLKNGNGSFNKIFTNILSICNSDIFNPKEHIINIRCNIDERNSENLWELMQLIEDHELNKKVIFYIKPVHKWENDADKHSVEKEIFSKFEIEFFSRKILKEYRDSNSLIPTRISTTCMATSSGISELIDVKGNVFNCTEMPFIERLEKYSLRNIEEENSKEDSYELEKWYDFVEEGTYSDCKNCNLLPICGGYCPKHWIDKHKQPCPSIKFNIEERVQLKYLLAQ